MRKLTQVEFLAKAVAAHGVGRYDYSQAVYAGGKKRLEIICPTHGVFKQYAANHFMGQGCPTCAGKTGTNHSLASFLEKAKTAHGEKYDYSQVVYSHLQKPVLIGCAVHGAFEQVARTHMRGSGCPRCALDQTAEIVRAKPRKYTIEKWKVEAGKQHEGRYDYSAIAELPAATSKIKIICPAHGLFVQAANYHLSGQGCPRCGRERIAENNRRSWIEQAAGKVCNLYLIRIFDGAESFYKVGITIHSVAWRYSARARLAGYQYEIVALHKSTNAAGVYEWEQSIIESFTELQYRPRRHFDGASECFSSCDEILSIFPL